jgi:hypothetical protein
MPDFYGSRTAFRTYHSTRGTDTTSYTDATVDAALIVASEFIDGRYGGLFIGLKTGEREQIREWPRTGAYDNYAYLIENNEIPREVENATYEAALKQLSSPGALFVDYQPSEYIEASVDGAVAVKFEKFNSVYDSQTLFAKVDNAIAGVLSPQLNMSRLSGLVGRV